jgi:hypothetical protein
VCKRVICDAHDKRFTKKQEKHMFYLPKSDTSVWQTGTSGLTRKTRTSGLENQTIRFFQTEHINKKTFTIEY